MDAAGPTFGPFELHERLGGGGMAEVHRATWVGDGFRKEVALKRIRPEVTDPQQQQVMLKALRREARLGLRLLHPNVVQVFESGESDGVVYLAMELVRGVTLEWLLVRLREAGTPMPPKVIAAIMRQLCAGLAYAHSAVEEDGTPMQLVHRDLKPANLMLDREGQLKIADFGVARADLQLQHTVTATGLTKGTPAYMSPEQVRGERPLDRRSDLFSAGTVLAEMITGELVFAGSHLYEVMHRIATADLGPVLDRVEARLPAMTPVVQRSLQRDKALRYATAEEMARDLVALGDRLPGDETLAGWLAPWLPAGTLTHALMPTPRIEGPEALGAGPTPPAPAPSTPTPQPASPTPRPTSTTPRPTPSTPPPTPTVPSAEPIAAVPAAAGERAPATPPPRRPAPPSQGSLPGRGRPPLPPKPPLPPGWRTGHGPRPSPYRPPKRSRRNGLLWLTLAGLFTLLALGCAGLGLVLFSLWLESTDPYDWGTYDYGWGYESGAAAPDTTTAFEEIPAGKDADAPLPAAPLPPAGKPVESTPAVETPPTPAQNGQETTTIYVGPDGDEVWVVPLGGGGGPGPDPSGMGTPTWATPEERQAWAEFEREMAELERHNEAILRQQAEDMAAVEAMFEFGDDDDTSEDDDGGKFGP